MVIGMHHIMLSSLVLASSAGLPASVELQNLLEQPLASVEDTCDANTTREAGPGPHTPNEFLDSLQAPVTFENVRPVVELTDGIHLDLSYELPETGSISIGMHIDGGGSGLGLVTVGETIVAELRFADGSVASETVDFSTLSPAQAHAVAASLMQVWREDAVTEAFTVATVDDRAKKCWLAGWLAGKVAGVFAVSACSAITGVPPACVAPGAVANLAVSSYVKGKCNGAQNGG